MVARSELVFTISTILTWCDPEDCISPSVPFLPSTVEISEVSTAEGDCWKEWVSFILKGLEQCMMRDLGTQVMAQASK